MKELYNLAEIILDLHRKQAELLQHRCEILEQQIAILKKVSLIEEENAS